MKEIRHLVDQAFIERPEMTSMFLALGKRHGGGGYERQQSKPHGQSRDDDGGVATERDLASAAAPYLRKMIKAIDQDPARSNAAIVARHLSDGVSIHVLIIHPGDIEKGQWASFEGYTEAEYFAIANGPKPERYPYLKMPAPVGEIIEIDAQGNISEPVTSASEVEHWADAPIDFASLPGAPDRLVVAESMSRQLPQEELDAILTKAVKDPFWGDLGKAIGMEPPSLRDIRRLGADNGYRDARGNPI